MSSNIIKFVHNNKINEIHSGNPNQTLLTYIRETLKKTGTKEGCSEGGCGACTVVIGNLEKNKIKYSAINSCILFLPSIHGKQLILVEDLETKNHVLHPVQKSMVKFNGSQCGYCTPGFIMSLFAMYKNNFSFNDENIKESIAGNLCRCTGYKPIINAAKDLNGQSKFDKFYKSKNKTINLLKIINKETQSLKLTYDRNKFFAPKNIKELKKILKNYPKSNLLSGGTDLSLIVTKERKNLESIIFLGSIDELNYINISKNSIEIGANTNLLDFEKYIKKYYRDFASIIKRYGSIQIRNLATIAGNIATASPIGDTLPLLLSLNCKVTIAGLSKDKKIPINKFFISYRKTILQLSQFIKSIEIPITTGNIFKAYKISKRFDDDISSVCASFNLEIKKNKINNIFIAYGGMAEIPKRARSCENTLINKEFGKEIILEAQKSLEKDFAPIDDMRASAKYRMRIAKNLLLKFFLEVQNNKIMRINE